jgi:LysR family carnitine catabolism transcriptional activator
MDLRRLQLFLAVVDHGGITRAARAELVSQPSVSQAMRELERELGVELFHRVGRGVVLSAAGEALVGPARQALRDVDTGRAAVAAVRGLEAGRLDLCALPTFAVDPLAPLVGAFRAEHPKVHLALADPDDSVALLALVTTGACEIGLTAEDPRTPGIRSHRLATQDLLGVLPPGSTTSGRTLAIAELARHPLVTGPAGTSTRRLLDDALADAGLVPDIAVVAAQREAILPLVLAGAGATIAARPLAEQAARLGATVLPLRPRVTRPVFALHRIGPLSPAAVAFLALAGVA